MYKRKARENLDVLPPVIVGTLPRAGPDTARAGTLVAALFPRHVAVAHISQRKKRWEEKEKAGGGGARRDRHGLVPGDVPRRRIASPGHGGQQTQHDTK